MFADNRHQAKTSTCNYMEFKKKNCCEKLKSEHNTYTMMAREKPSCTDGRSDSPAKLMANLHVE